MQFVYLFVFVVFFRMHNSWREAGGGSGEAAGSEPAEQRREGGGGGGGEGEAGTEVRKCERMGWEGSGGEGRGLLTDGDKRRLIFMCVDLRLTADPSNRHTHY